MEIFKLFGSIFVNTGEADKSIAKTEKHADSFATKLGNGIKTAAKWGAAIVAAAGTIAVAIGTKAVVAASNFETSFAQVNTLLSDTVNLDEYKKKIIDLSNKTGVATDSLCESIYSAISASVEESKAIEFVESALKLAEGGFTDAATAVDVMTTAINAYGLSAEDATQVSDYLITTQNLGKTTVDELASSLGKVIPIASAYGVKMDDLSANMAILTKNGIATAEATTYTKAMLNELGDSGSDVSAILREQTGKTFGELKESGLSLGEIIAILGDSVDNDSAAFNELWSSSEAGVGALTLLKTGAEEYNNVLDTMRDSSGATTEAYETMHNTFATKVDQLKTVVTNTLVEVGNTLLPFATSIVDWVIEKMPLIQGIIQTAIGTVKAAVEAFHNILQTIFLNIQGILGDTGITFDTIMASVQDIFSVTWSVLSGIWDGVGQPLLSVIMSAASFLMEHWDVIAEGIKMAFQILWDICGNLWTSIGQPIFDAVQQTMDVLMENWDVVAESMENIFQTLWDVCETLWDTIGKPIWDMISFVVSEVARVFSQHMGGIISFFGNMTAGIRDTWNNHLKPVFDAIGAFLNEFLVPIFKFAFDVIIGPLVSNVFDTIKRLWTDTLKPVFDGICDFLLGVFTCDWDKAFSGILNIVTGIFNGIITAVQKPMDLVRDIVDKAVNFILDKFNFKWEFPSIKLPHFSIEGTFSLSPPSVPSIGIDWYAKGGILQEPTAFGINPENGNAMVGGEAGPEAVAPIETLQQYVREAVDSQNQQIIEVLIQILGAITSMDQGLLEKILEALESCRFEIREREFARLVREV